MENDELIDAGYLMQDGFVETRHLETASSIQYPVSSIQYPVSSIQHHESRIKPQDLQKYLNNNYFTPYYSVEARALRKNQTARALRQASMMEQRPIPYSR